jgi:hypothetical protein
MIDRKIYLLRYFSSQLRLLFINLRESRNLKDDAAVILGVAPQEIAWSREELTAKTKVYIGKLYADFFTENPKLEKIYTSFPESEVVKSTLVLNAKSPEMLVRDLLLSNTVVYEGARRMILSPEFSQQKQPLAGMKRFLIGLFGQTVPVVKLRISDLGFQGSATTEEVFSRAKTLGLELCSPEMGPLYRLAHSDVSNNLLVIGMKPLLVTQVPEVFTICTNGFAKPGPALDVRTITAGDYWRRDDEVLFQIKTQ